jgi:hypothetical protein
MMSRLLLLSSSLSLLALQAEAYLTTTVHTTQHHTRPVATTRLAFTPKAENEWGIPNSSDLPPLASPSKPVPSTLPNGGKVTLVGSGPGDPELLTLKAYKLLTENQGDDTLIISDRLVSQEILDLIPSDQLKIARKLPGCAELAQEEIYWWAYQALNQGKHVIRLKIGDPFVFGRGGEEVLLFRRLGVEAAVVPVRTLYLSQSV